jgi:hypothetical protein
MNWVQNFCLGSAYYSLNLSASKYIQVRLRNTGLGLTIK